MLMNLNLLLHQTLSELLTTFLTDISNPHSNLDDPQAAQPTHPMKQIYLPPILSLPPTYSTSCVDYLKVSP